MVTNEKETVISSSGLGIGLNDVNLEGFEEANGRLLLHFTDEGSTGAKRVVSRSKDIDVLLLTVSHFRELMERGQKEPWLIFGTGKYRIYIPALPCRRISWR